MSELNDKELFEQAISDEPVVEQPGQETAPEEQPAVSRDDKGRFATKTEKTEARPEPVVETRTEATPQAEPAIPPGRLREEADARRKAERELDEMRGQMAAMMRMMNPQRQDSAPEPIDFFANPDAAISQRLNPLQQHFAGQMQEMKNHFSEMFARQVHGDAKFDAAKEWAKTRMNDPALEARIARSNNPWGELIKSYDEHKTLSEIGTDPNAFIQKKLDEALNNPEFLAKAMERARVQAGGPSSQPSPVKLPPSINRATSAAPSHDPPGDMSDRSLYEFATR